MNNLSIIVAIAKNNGIGKDNQLLYNRRNSVLSRHAGLGCAGAECFTSLEEALAHCNAEEEIFIMGGASVYKEALPLTHRLYITLVHDTGKQADAFFPEIDEKVWKETGREDHHTDEKHLYPYINPRLPNSK